MITSAENFDCYKDGAVYHIEYATKPNSFEESPIDYYLPFQFYDVDFDGEKELLINDYYQGQQGNYYEVFEITNSGLETKRYPPFNSVDNMMKFDNLNPEQTTFRAQVQQLAQLRRNNMALLYGEYIPVKSTDTLLHFQRAYMGDIVDVRIDLNGESSITVNGDKVWTL